MCCNSNSFYHFAVDLLVRLLITLLHYLSQQYVLLNRKNQVLGWKKKNIKGYHGAAVVQGIPKDDIWLSFATRLTINAAHHFQKLQTLYCTWHNKYPGEGGEQIILEHDNVWPLTAHLCMKGFRISAGNFFPIHPIVQSQLPSTLNCSGSQKDQMQGQHYATNEAVQETVQHFDC